MNEPTWRRSSHSVDDNCIELARLDDGIIGVRDSNDPNGIELHVTSDDLVAFLRGAKAGEFDDLT